MNERIRSHFDEIEVRIIESSAIVSYQVMRRDISPSDGKLRIRSTLTDGGVFECFLYVEDTEYQIQPLKYSYHWQDSTGNPIRRMDNAPHHPNLSFAPDHLHIGTDHVEGFPGDPDIFAFIDELERSLSKE